MTIQVSLGVAVAMMLSGCASPATPTSVTCSDPVITIGLFSNGAPPSPGQGLVWSTHFAATVLPAQATVYIVDLNFTPPGCAASWSAVSTDTSAVQLSPASGSGRGQVELFMPSNTGAQRSTIVAIAGQTALITQSGR